jgi:hypothetical protein
LTQNDIRAGGVFPDVVAYGGWPMDDHNPLGMDYSGEPTIFHPAPSPYGIPYRCLYSRNIENLFCAGRNISATHAALSSARVMGTCSMLGQAVGTAASVAFKRNINCRGVYSEHIKELQGKLLENDCFIPGLAREVSELSRTAQLTASHGDPKPLRNGIDRPGNSGDNAWTGPEGAWVEYSFGKNCPIKEVRLVFDSDLDRTTYGMMCSYPLEYQQHRVPAPMVKSFRIEIQRTGENNWQTVFNERCNYQRFVRIPLGSNAARVRLLPEQAWNSDHLRVFAFEVR